MAWVTKHRAETMDATDLRSKLEAAGELMVAVGEFEQPLELHIHDTEIGEDTIVIDLADGELEFEIQEISGVWKHKHTLADFGLED